MIDKDGVFIDRLENDVWYAWKEGQITNEFRNKMVDVIQEVRDWL